jgi:hypothetical protein
MAASSTGTESIIDILPLELVHVICSFLPVPDISTFRLLNKACAKVGERNLVENLHVMFNAKSLQNLLHISRHPSLCRYVSSILYEVRYLEDVESQEYESNILDNDGLEEESTWSSDAESGDSKERIARGWKAYKPMLEEQLYMKKISYDVSVFTQALARFPVLKRLEMCSEYGMPSETLARAYENTLAVPGLMLDGGEISDYEEQTGTRALGSLLLAAAAMPSRLETLIAHRIHWSFFNPAPLADLHLPAFVQLRHLDLVLEPDYDDFDEQDVVKKRHEELGRILRSMMGLESLRLCFDDVDTHPNAVLIQRQMNVPVVWERITEGMTWPRLRILELKVFTTSENHITNFLKRHTDTLRVIKWHNVWLSDSAFGWNRIFKKMKRYMKLEEVEFRGIWGGDCTHGRPKLLKMEGETAIRLERSILRGPSEKKEKNPNNKAHVATEPPVKLETLMFEFVDYELY